MRRLRLAFDLCRLTYQRLAHRPMLTILALVGIVLAVGLLSSAGFFSQAVDRVILLQELEDLSQTTGRIPFSMRVYFQPSSRKPVSLIDAEKVGQSIGGTLADEIGLPLKRSGVQIESGGLMLVPMPDDARYGANKSFLNTVNVVYIADVADHLAVVSGDPVGMYDPVDPETLDVWMHARLAEEMGIRVGERYQVTINLRTAPRKIYIRGLWQAKDITDDFWFSNPDTTLRTALLVTRTGYLQFMDPMLPAKSGFVNWHLILDDQPLNPKYATDYAIGFEQGMTVVNRYMPGARLDVSPLDPLKEFVGRQSKLTLVLLGFNIPALAFLLYFLLQISLIIVRWQQRETALLVSRGMNLGSILGLTLLEEFALFLIGTPLGILFGMGIARWMGQTASFLAFTDRPPLPVSLQGLDFTLIGIALAVALLSRIAPTIQAARQSVVEQAREGARSLRAPFWQRSYLDFILILPTYYVYQQLTLQGTLATGIPATRGPFGITSPEESAAQFFQDPLLVLAPTLFILCITLLSMRFFPWLLRFFDLIASRTPWLTLHLALRQLGRNSQSYVNPLLLVIVALAMGIYTRSMAESLDQWLVDQVYYRIGADASFLPYIEPPEGEGGGASSGGDGELRSEGLIPPVDTFAALPGVTAATRVGDYQVRIPNPNSGEIKGRMLALDRVDFSTVAWFRPDFADEPLGALMNRLALAPENVLVTREFLQALTLRIGDQFNMSVRLADGIAYTGAFRVAGIYRYFPTVQNDEAVVIGNLDHLYTQSGAEFEHFIWLRTQANADVKALFQEVKLTGVEPTLSRDARGAIATDQAKMERVGIFGTLSVGFLAATVMAMLALLVHNYASLQERLYQFGVMRAIGLWRGQVIVQVVLEYGMLTIYGAVIGSLIGLYTAEFFAPFFRIPEGAGAPLPPLLPIIAEDATMTLGLLFAGLMILSELLVMTRALTMRIFTTLRMGHQG